MSSGNQAKANPEEKKSKRPKPDQVTDNFTVDKVEGLVIPKDGYNVESLDGQAAWLKRLGRRQRQEMVSQLGRDMGNRHVQRLINAVDSGREKKGSSNGEDQRRAVTRISSTKGPAIVAVLGGGDRISRREATFLERRAWLSFFAHYLPRKFLNNYMDDTGDEITLTQQEMIDCNPIVNLARMRSRALQTAVASLRSAGGGTQPLSGAGYGGARTNGTLGNFTINYNGDLTVSAGGDWSFLGTMNFYDFWDFDPKPFSSGSGRPAFAEIRVRAAAYGLPGRPFHIRSVDTTVSQTSEQTGAGWAGGAPVTVASPLVRSAADVGAGGDVGGGADIIAGPDVSAGGDVAGGDVGANVSEDFNP